MGRSEPRNQRFGLEENEMALLGVPPSEGDWTVRIGADEDYPGSYTLETRCNKSWVTGGPAILRFKKPEDAVSFVSAFAPIQNEGLAARELASGLYVESTGSSEVWRPIMFALYHSAGPRGGYLASAFHADGGPSPIILPYDPEYSVPEDCDILLQSHESTDPRALERPDGSSDRRTVVWHEVGWEPNQLDYYTPFIEIRFEDTAIERLRLVSSPLRRIRDQAILLHTEEGVYVLHEHAKSTSHSAENQDSKENPLLWYRDIPPSLQKLIKEMMDKVFEKCDFEDAEVASQDLQSFVSGDLQMRQNEISSKLAQLLRMLT